MSQFDCKAGTNGDASCISFGKLKVAKAFINKALGAIIEPNIFSTEIVKFVEKIKLN